MTNHLLLSLDAAEYVCGAAELRAGVIYPEIVDCQACRILAGLDELPAPVSTTGADWAMGDVLQVARNAHDQEISRWLQLTVGAPAIAVYARTQQLPEQLEQLEEVEPLTPRFPEGTPEYAAYRAELTVELAKFAAHEAPYDHDELAGARRDRSVL